MMDGVLNKLMEIVNDLDQGQFRQLTTTLVENMELEISSSKMKGGDIIIEAMKSEPDGDIPFIIKFKRGRGKVGPDHVQEIVLVRDIDNQRPHTLRIEAIQTVEGPWHKPVHASSAAACRIL